MDGSGAWEVMLLVIATVGLMGNSIVIIIYANMKQLGKATIFFFIKAFAVADLISALAILSNLNATTVSNDIIRHV